MKNIMKNRVFMTMALSIINQSVQVLKKSNVFIVGRNIHYQICNYLSFLKYFRSVKTLKNLGFPCAKGTNKISISSLSKEKIKKLSNLRVI